MSDERQLFKSRCTSDAYLISRYKLGSGYRGLNTDTVRCILLSAWVRVSLIHISASILSIQFNSTTLPNKAINSTQLKQFEPSSLLPPPSLSPPPPHTTVALALPTLATYPSKEALFEAIQNWSKPRGYAFSIQRSRRLRSWYQRVQYACDRWVQLNPIRT
jgi:hypothetical protein